MPEPQPPGRRGFEKITIRHSKYAASRFAQEAGPALIQFADSSPMPFVNGIKAAREQIVARAQITELPSKPSHSEINLGCIFRLEYIPYNFF